MTERQNFQLCKAICQSREPQWQKSQKRKWKNLNQDHHLLTWAHQRKWRKDMHNNNADVFSFSVGNIGSGTGINENRYSSRCFAHLCSFFKAFGY
nr:hypothetical protein BaRGS_032233 [Batillaria attramentaria]KAG5714012.1 hypothetical protein BaRGS_020340 [Batillaria attramentaria]